MSKSLRAGAGSAAIEIPEDFYPYKSFRGRYFTGQHDDILARCILVENDEQRVLFVSFDLGDFGRIPEWKKKIQSVIQVPDDYIFITVTHDHDTPHVCDDLDQKVEDVEKTALFGGYVWNALEKALRECERNVRPAVMYVGSGTCDINQNRDFLERPMTIIKGNPHGLSDKTVDVVRFDDTDGNPIAIIMNYSVHGSVMMGVAIEDGGMYVSGDLPGFASRYVEEAYGNGVVAMFTSGAAADQDPKYPAKRQQYVNGRDEVLFDAGRAGYVLVRVMAESLADEVLYVSNSMQECIKEADIHAIQTDCSVPGKESRHMAPKNRENFDYADADPINLHLSLLSIGPVAFAGIPGELVCHLGQMVKETLRDKYEKVIVLTHCNGSISYISDIEGFDNYTPESARSHIKKGWAEKAILGGLKEMSDG